MAEEILKSLYDWNPWFEGEFPEELVGHPRSLNLDPYLQIPEIKILEGARRVGKSTLLYQIMKKLVAENKKILYINFEDEILKKYSLGEIIASCQEPVQFLFVDEIQNCHNWVPFIRKAYDRKEIPQIWISGSNSAFIKKEFATLLTGRNITINVYPLSFEEYLHFKSVKETRLPFSTKKEVIIKNHFKQYLELGAFPAVALRPVLQKELLITYFEDFIYKDIASRHDVNVVKIKELGLYLATNSAKSFSYRGCATALGMHHKTIMDYCSYFFEIFLFRELYKFDYSLKNQIGTDKKVYIADTGLANAISFRFSEDQGRILENIVHNELHRRGEEIYFHKQKYECDFIIKKELKISRAIQVTKTIKDPDVKSREYRGLLEAMHQHQLSEGLILTLDEEGVEEIEEDGRRMQITCLPTWKWLLSA
ncbi:MAG: ATP-binding protein [Verrucomicrobia bacterium]|nr:ATP-binding protein [Verrucomicrobiota bacterium]